MSILTSEEFKKRLESFKQRVINTWDYSNRDSYSFPRLPQLEADEAVRRNELIAHNESQRQRIAQLEADLKEAAKGGGFFGRACARLLEKRDVLEAKNRQLEAEVERLKRTTGA